MRLTFWKFDDQNYSFLQIVIAQTKFSESTFRNSFKVFLKKALRCVASPKHTKKKISFNNDVLRLQRNKLLFSISSFSRLLLSVAICEIHALEFRYFSNHWEQQILRKIKTL